MNRVGLISSVIGTKLPGPGAIYAGQSLVTVCRNQRGEDVFTGEADIFYRP